MILADPMEFTWTSATGSPVVSYGPRSSRNRSGARTGYVVRMLSWLMVALYA